MNLVSLANSGESLDKAVALSFLSHEFNKSFYQGYDTVEVYYSDNLPKLSSDFNAHGTFSAALPFLNGSLGFPYRTLDDMWEDREAITKRMQEQDKITSRIAHTLEQQEDRFRRTIGRLSWGSLYPEYEEKLVHAFSQKCGNFRFIRMNLKRDFNDLQASIPTDYPVAKVYTLTSDGMIGSRGFGYAPKEEETKPKGSLEKSVVASGNIYLFLTHVKHLNKNRQDAVLGYREMKKFPRAAYDHALTSLFDLGLPRVVEPSNKGFGDILGTLPEELKQERKTAIAVYQTLGRHM